MICRDFRTSCLIDSDDRGTPEEHRRPRPDEGWSVTRSRVVRGGCRVFGLRRARRRGESNSTRMRPWRDHRVSSRMERDSGSVTAAIRGNLHRAPSGSTHANSSPLTQHVAKARETELGRDSLPPARTTGDRPMKRRLRFHQLLSVAGVRSAAATTTASHGRERSVSMAVASGDRGLR
jgi:hypothetical protein